MHWRQRWLLSREFLIKITGVCTSVLRTLVSDVNGQTVVGHTMVGKYGGGMRLLKMSSKLTSLKNGCLLISSASPLPDPRRRAGSLVNNYGGVTLGRTTGYPWGSPSAESKRRREAS
jgi:hypothetical protein